MKQGEFCERAGIKQQTLSGIETGRSEPSTALLQQLFQNFPDLNPDWLLLGTGPMLRDGRTLTPASAALSSDPTPDGPPAGGAQMTANRTSPEEASHGGKVVDYTGSYIKLLERQVLYLEEKVDRLEKPLPAPDAAWLPARAYTMRPAACLTDALADQPEAKVVQLWPAAVVTEAAA